MTHSKDDTKNFEQNELSSKAVFARLGAMEMSPDPFLKTRVLARQGEISKRSQQFVFWKGFAAGALGLGLAFSVYNYVTGSRYVTATEKIIAIRVGAPDSADMSQVAYVRVELPEGVKFQSKTFPQVAEQPSLKLQWSQSRDGKNLLILVRSDQDGLKKVHVSFFDSSDRFVSSDDVQIRFKKDTSNKGPI